MSNQFLRPVRLAACLVSAMVVLAACGASGAPGQVSDAGTGAAGANVPTWPATATPDWSFLPDGPSFPADATSQPTATAEAAGGGSGAGSSSSSTSGGLSAATDAQLEQLLQQANQALDAANAAASDDSAQSGQDEGAIP